MAAAMQTHLSAGGASCQICFEPFGPLEDLSAPFIISCGHVFCVGYLSNLPLRCLSNTGPSCPLCGLRTTVPRRPRRSYDSEVIGCRLRSDFVRVSSLTSVIQLRSLHSEARYFLNLQPRNRSSMMNTFVEQIHHLSAEKIDLSLQLGEMERRHASERAYIRNHVSDILRRDPFQLLSEEVLQFQTDMNDLRESVHTLRVQNGVETPTTPAVLRQPTPEFALAYGPVPSAIESAYESLSPLSMSAIGDDFGTGEPQVYSDNLDIPPRTGTRSSSSDAARERQAVFAQIRRRSRLQYSSAPNLRSLSENPGLTSSESREQDGESSSLYSSERDEGDTPYYSPLASMDDSLISQALAPRKWIRGAVPETPSIQSIDEHLDHADNTSAPISTISTPSLPLLQTPPGLRFQADLDSRLNNQLHLSAAASQPRLISEQGIPLPLPPRLRRPHSLAPSLNVRALTELLQDLVGRAPDRHGHYPSNAGGSHSGGGSGVQVQGAGLFSDVRTGLEVIGRVFMQLAANGVHVVPTSALVEATQARTASTLLAGAGAAPAESPSVSALDALGGVAVPLPVRATLLPPLDDG
ncbi:hypothetical protein BJ912DRAFT_961423, partial [Pholiota molesta]